MLSDEDQARIAEAIRQAEAGTSGEIVCVIARASSAYSPFPAIWASLLALATPWPLIQFTDWTVQRIFLAQLGAFALAFALLRLPMLAQRLAPRAVMRARAERAALEQFALRGLARTRGRTGVLIFASLAERYARIVADDGVARLVDQEAWDGALAPLLAHARDGRLAEGCVETIARCGVILARVAPPESAGTDELPNRVYLI